MNPTPPNQPDEAAQRTAHNLRVLAELIDLGMQLARAAAAQALARLAEPEAPAAEEREAEPPPDPPEKPPSERPANAAPATPRGATFRALTSLKPIDPALLYIRLTTAICSCIALQTRLAQNPANQQTTLDPAIRADPRRIPIREGFRIVLYRNPDYTPLIRETSARLDEELATDPERTRTISELLTAICEDLGIEIDYSKLPNEYLSVQPEDITQEEIDTPIFDWERALQPRATSPPKPTETPQSLS